MSTAVAAAPVAATLAGPSPEQQSSTPTRQYAPVSATNGSATTPSKQARPSSNGNSPSSNDGSAKKSPTSAKSTQGPKIIVKKEPSSPELQTSRHRPRRLDLSSNKHSGGPGALSARPSGSVTAKELGSTTMQDVGLACLSPGFHTQDPAMREQLQRSIDVRDRQRQIIEARQKSAKGVDDGPGGSSERTPSTSRRRGPPPGLTIAPPSHERFASERVIQSAPLNQSFTGLRQVPQPATRHTSGQNSNLSRTSHIHHVPATQTNNRLPPIADVFAPETLGTARPPTSRPTEFSHSPGQPNQQAPLPSPGFQQSQANRKREYKSAEEAQQSLAGGREELLPRIVHYGGGHQPPTPPSPMPPKGISSGLRTAPLEAPHSSHARRRNREEYERDMGSPPLGRQAERLGPFGAGRDSPETQKAKKEEFIQLCSRAWDLFHS